MCHGHLLSDVQLVMPGNIQSVGPGYRCLSRDPIYIWLICTNEGGWNATRRYQLCHGLFFLLLTHPCYRTKLCHLRGKIRIIYTWTQCKWSHIFKSEHQLHHFSFALPFCLFVLTSLHCHGPLNVAEPVIQTGKDINCKRHSVWKHWRVPRLTSFVIYFDTLHIIKSIIKADQCQNPTSTKSGYNYAYIM